MMDRQLKQRVVGAALLVAFGVIFIPIFLDNGVVESPVPPTMSIPPAPREDVGKRVPELSDEAVGELEARAENELEPSTAETTDASGASVTPALPTANPAIKVSPPAAAAAAALNPAVITGRPNSATATATKAPSLPAATVAKPQALASALPPVLAPRVPPALTKLAPGAAMDTTTATIRPPLATPKETAGLAGKMALVTPALSVPRDPPVPASKLAAALAPAGWTVQLGSFASDVNATHLVDRLRAAGFKANSERRVEQGTPVFKVRVGPVPTRAEAERMRERVESQFAAHGMLVPVQ